MKFTGFSPDVMKAARDTCRVPNLYFADGSWTSHGCRTDEGMVIRREATDEKPWVITTVLRVGKVPQLNPDGTVLITRGGAPRLITNPFCRKTTRGRSTAGAATWEAHYQFMRRLYQLNGAEGIIESSFFGPTKYLSELDFYVKCGVTEDKVVQKPNVTNGYKTVRFGEL